MLKSRETEARRVLRKLVSSNDVGSIEDEIADIKQSLNEHTNPNCSQEVLLILKWKNLRRYLKQYITNLMPICPVSNVDDQL